MKKILIIIVGLSVYFTARSQDIIVTTDNDSINCIIKKVDNNFIYFTFNHKGDIRTTLLPVNQVKVYSKDFYGYSEIGHQNRIYEPEYHRWRFVFNGGYSYRIAKIPDNVSYETRDYLKKLKSGFNISFDASYYFTEIMGAGLKYDLYKSSGSSQYGKDNISISFIGPAFYTRIYNHSKTNYWNFNFAIGYMGYRDKGELKSIPVTIKGNTAGFVWDIGYDFRISDNWAMGFQVSLVSGILYEYKVTENGRTKNVKLEKGSYEGLTHLNLNIGIRCNL